MAQRVKFDEFVLDAPNGQLLRGSEEIKLSHKAMAVLEHLLQRPGQLVTRDELFSAVWPGVIVSDGSLGECIREIRKGLGDSARAPRFIETVHRRGYRFIEQPAGEAELVEVPVSTVASTRRVVGRDAEFAQLAACSARSRAGQRQIVFIIGEAGIGKSTLVDAYVEHVANQGQCRVAYGQCIDQFGAGEPYLPVLEALGRLCHDVSGKEVIAGLRKYAPTWLVQLPALLSDTEMEKLQRQTAGTTQRGMLREMAAALEAISAETPLILVIEDLHWSDHATIELLATVARRRERAQLFILCTYRPVDVLTREHPVKAMHQELRLHGQCAELAVDFLTETGVAQYLSHRLDGAELPENLARHVHGHTDGNPLFVVNVTDALLQRQTLRQRDGQWVLGVEPFDVPAGLRDFIVQQFEQLGADEQRCMEAASVAGVQFSAALVAAGVKEPVERIEAICDGLVEQLRFLNQKGDVQWPDGSIAGHYGFLHSLYREVFYQRLPPRRRGGLHLRIANRLEAAYGDRADDIATELAIHFEQAREAERAIAYFTTAAHGATLRGACNEAIGLVRRGLALLPGVVDTTRRTQQELRLQLELGAAVALVRGSAVRDVETIYQHAFALSEQIDEPLLRYGALAGLQWFHFLRADFVKARALADELLVVSKFSEDPASMSSAWFASGITSQYRGELQRALVDFDRAISLEWRPPLSGTLAEPTVRALSFSSLCLHALGFPDQALQRNERALARARDNSHPFSLVFAISWAASIRNLRMEPEAALDLAAEGITLCNKYEGMDDLLAGLMLWRGAALAALGEPAEAITLVNSGMRVIEHNHLVYALPSLKTLVAGVHLRGGKLDEADAFIREGLNAVGPEANGHAESPLKILQGRSVLAQDSGKQIDAEACFQRALEVARRHETKMDELNAVTSLSRLWQAQGRAAEAYEPLREIISWFTEGQDLRQLQYARALLAELAPNV